MPKQCTRRARRQLAMARNHFPLSKCVDSFRWYLFKLICAIHTTTITLGEKWIPALWPWPLRTADSGSGPAITNLQTWLTSMRVFALA